jgi:hypothetical protein
VRADLGKDPRAKNAQIVRRNGLYLVGHNFIDDDFLTERLGRKAMSKGQSVMRAAILRASLQGPDVRLRGTKGKR